MLEVLLGTKNRELTLQYLLTFKEGYAREIAKYFDIALPSVQNQLKNFEEGGLALSKMQGRTKIYFLNPRYAFLEELTSLLDKAKQYYKPELKEKFEMQRKRPRRPEKPLYNGKTTRPTQYKPKTNTIIREENSGTADTSGKYINPAAYRQRLKKQCKDSIKF